MKKGESSRIEALEALIAEKRKLEGYLAKLDERREGTPEHVYVRLRDEYVTKLTDAQVRAHAEAETISGGLDEDDDAIREIEERLAAFKEEKVEGELRAVVGELDAKEWAKKLTTLNASISLAEKELDARATAVERTRAMLAEAKGSSVAAAPRGSGDAAAKDAKELKDAKDAKKPGMTGAPSFDELAFLNSVVGRTTGSIPSVPSTPAPNVSKPVEQSRDEPKPARTSTPPAVPSAPSEPAAGERTGGPSVTAERVPAAKRATPAATETASDKPSTASGEPPKVPELTVAAPPAQAPAPATSDSTAKADAAKAETAKAEAAKADVAKAEAEAAAAEPDAFGRPTPRTSQAVKTLKCQECGTFNFPTEWYCERCGGELAAL